MTPLKAGIANYERCLSVIQPWGKEKGKDIPGKRVAP